MADETWNEFNQLVIGSPWHQKIAIFLGRTLDYRCVQFGTFQLAVLWISATIESEDPVPPDDLLQEACNKAKDIIDTGDTEPGPYSIEARQLVGPIEDLSNPEAADESEDVGEPDPEEAERLRKKITAVAKEWRQAKIDQIDRGETYWGRWIYQPQTADLLHKSGTTVNLHDLKTDANIGGFVSQFATESQKFHPSDIGFFVKAVTELRDLGYPKT